MEKTPHSKRNFGKKPFNSRSSFKPSFNSAKKPSRPTNSKYEGSKPFVSKSSFNRTEKPRLQTSPRYMGSKPIASKSYSQNQNIIKPAPKKQFTPKIATPISSDTSLIRINKYLALKNYSTRRGADELIEKGRVFINGKLAVLGDKVSETGKVEVRFRGKPKPYMYIAYNKPRGIVTHSAQRGEQEIKNVFALKDVYPIGRLDKDSHGLIILTNDGRITERLLGPKYFHEKEYLVTTKNNLRSNFKEKMEAGVKIENEQTAKCKVQILGERAFRVILTEGKKHQIRRMCSALFQEVDDLKRTRIMNIKLESLSEGAHRKIEGEELETFLKALKLI